MFEKGNSLLMHVSLELVYMVLLGHMDTHIAGVA
jgi:hypothetical protein